MRLWIAILLLSCSCAFAQDRFKIVDSRVQQIISDSQALCVYKGELVLIDGLDFSKVADGFIIRSKAHGSYRGTYRYETVTGATKTVRVILIVDNGERR